MADQKVDPETGEILPVDPTTDGELTLFPGGQKPTKAVLKLKAGKKEISNELHRGDEIALLVHARIDEIAFTGENRIHIATVLDIFEHDTGGLAPAQAMMSTTDSPIPTDDLPAIEDAAFERGEDEEQVGW